MEISRRTFLARTSAVAGAGYVLSSASPAAAFPLALPLGIQSYDLTKRLTEDLNGTLRTLKQNGYQWIDFLAVGRTNVPALAAMPAKDVHKLFADHGLATHNVHVTWADLHDGYAKTIEAVHAHEATSVVCTTVPASQGHNLKTADGWKWHADDLNAIGERTKKDGVLAGYHTHPVEFTDVEGVTPFDLLLKTDPSIVKMLLDVGACAVAGKDPVAYLTKYPDHYFSIHAKDVKDGKLGVAVGEGILDWKKVFAAAKGAKLRHYVVETGATDAEVLEKTKMSIDYLRAMSPI
jgi:sugar phosphate isomerase/epimerase